LNLSRSLMMSYVLPPEGAFIVASWQSTIPIMSFPNQFHPRDLLSIKEFVKELEEDCIILSSQIQGS
jgi:hypothetical protein